MSRRIKLTVAYDGTAYCGWQIQPNGVTVQEVLGRALKDLLGEEVKTTAASRTDSGVHARGNVAVFETDSRMPAERFAFALNTYLPEDIRVQGSEEVPRAFHPRFTDTIKTYEYKILHRVFSDPTRRHDSLFCYGPLDVPAMRHALSDLVGEHDFKSFQGSGGEASTKTTVRTIYSAELFRESVEPSAFPLEYPGGAFARENGTKSDPDRAEYLLRIRLTGNGFLYNMVRIIVGTLLEIGRGHIAPDAMPAILAARNRNAAGPTAPAHGLTLLSIRYPEWEQPTLDK